MCHHETYSWHTSWPDPAVHLGGQIKYPLKSDSESVRVNKIVGSWNFYVSRVQVLCNVLYFYLCSPIFAEIVPEKSRTSIYALDWTFESILASFAPPAVGLLSQHVFGYKPIPQGSTQSVEVEMGRGNAASLAKALCINCYSNDTVLPHLLLSLLYLP